jgi:expansin (peptidoglycan-binding protein)
MESPPAGLPGRHSSGSIRSVQHSRRNRRPRRWLKTTSLPAGLGVVAVLLLAPHILSTDCAAYRPAALLAQPPGTAARSGTATYYTLVSGAGNCSYVGPPADELYVALGPDEYAAAAACGGYLDVTGPLGTVRVKVVDQCPECEIGHLDLSRQAFARIGAIREGVIPITYRAVRDPQVPGPLSVRVKEGSSQYWLALLIIDHGNPLTSVEVRRGGQWQALWRPDYNYWIAEGGAGAGPFTIRVTDTAGHRAVADGITLSPQAVQDTGVFMYKTLTAPTARQVTRSSRTGPASRAAAAPDPAAATQPAPTTGPTLNTSAPVAGPPARPADTRPARCG